MTSALGNCLRTNRFSPYKLPDMPTQSVRLLTSRSSPNKIRALLSIALSCTCLTRRAGGAQSARPAPRAMSDSDSVARAAGLCRARPGSLRPARPARRRSRDPISCAVTRHDTPAPAATRQCPNRARRLRVIARAGTRGGGSRTAELETSAVSDLQSGRASLARPGPAGPAKSRCRREPPAGQQAGRPAAVARLASLQAGVGTRPAGGGNGGRAAGLQRSEPHRSCRPAETPDRGAASRRLSSVRDASSRPVSVTGRCGRTARPSAVRRPEDR